MSFCLRFSRLFALTGFLTVVVAGVLTPSRIASAQPTLTALHSFTGGGAKGPFAAMIQGTDGNLYGTTVSGGLYNLGTVFRMTPAGTVTLLHSFAGGTTDGDFPSASLIQATHGNFY